MSVITGFHAIEESLRSNESGKLFIAGKGERIEKLVGVAKSTGIPVHRVGSQELDRLAKGQDHRGAVYLIEGPGKNIQPDLKSAISEISSETALVVVLDGVTDPHNLGAILRSADLFEVDFVILPANRSARLNPTVAKTSAGASNYVPVVSIPNLTRALDELKRAGFWIYGADAGGKPAYEIDLTGKVALVMGSEGRGLGRLVRERCDEILSIPVRGNIDSLNVSVAAGVCIYEVRRQQDFRYGRSRNRNSTR